MLVTFPLGTSSGGSGLTIEDSAVSYTTGAINNCGYLLQRFSYDGRRFVIVNGGSDTANHIPIPEGFRPKYNSVVFTNAGAAVGMSAGQSTMPLNYNFCLSNQIWETD